MTKSTQAFLLGIVLALIALYIYRQYQKAQAQGKPFDIWSSLFGPVTPASTPMPVAKYVYLNKKCYLQSGNNTSEVDLKNCYNMPQLATDLQSEYNNLANQVSSLPNVTDPNNAANLALWQARQQQIVNILKEIKGCAPRQGIDIPTLTCI